MVLDAGRIVSPSNGSVLCGIVTEFYRRSSSVPPASCSRMRKASSARSSTRAATGRSCMRWRRVRARLRERMDIVWRYLPSILYVCSGLERPLTGRRTHTVYTSNPSQVIHRNACSATSSLLQLQCATSTQPPQVISSRAGTHNDALGNCRIVWLAQWGSRHPSNVCGA